jgi:PIN domain nuclease of toxin-antitoxin system
MRYLLDTSVFLWLIFDQPSYSMRAAHLFRDTENTFFLSAVSVWEIVQKYMLGKLILHINPVHIPEQRKLHFIDELPLDEESCLRLRDLPPIHKDPFDRMLVCQAIAHGLIILTPDKDIRQYPIETIW